MQNSIEKNDVQINFKAKPKKIQLLISKIKIKEKPIIKKYITQYFENPQTFFNSKFGKKKIILNKFKSPSEKYEVPLPNRLLKKYKRRKSKQAQMINDTTIKEQIAEMASVVNNNSKEKKRIVREISESKKEREDKREINDQELQKLFSAFEKVRKINKNKINNFITKNEYVDLMHMNKKENEDDKNDNNENETEKNNNMNIEKNKNNNNDDINDKKLIKSKSSISNRNFQINSDFEDKIISSKITKFHDRYNNNMFNKIKTNRQISMPKLSTKNNDKNFPPFESAFAEIISKRTIPHKNEDPISTINSQYSTLYKTRNKTFYSKFKKPINISEKGSEMVDSLLQKQSQYVLKISSSVMQKEFMKKLASQERALKHNYQYNHKIKNLLKTMSNQLQKEKGDLMLGQIDDYIIIKDLKTRLNNIMKKAYPENHYKWDLELRNSKNEESNDYDTMKSNNYIKKEIIRNPKTISNRARSQTIFGEYDDKYIQKSVPKTAYSKFVKDIDTIRGNFEGLIIEGQNLLKYEKDLIKKIKGKKMLINYNNIYKDKDLGDTLFAYNVSINKYKKP